MRAASGALITDIANQVSTLCRLFRITRTDGTVLRFTDAPNPVTIGGDGTYRSDLSFVASAISLSSLSPTQQNYTISLIMSDTGFAEGDVRAQRYNSATADLFICNAAVPANGVMSIFHGVFGAMTIVNDQTVDINVGMVSDLYAPTVAYESYAPTCRWSLGDVNCNHDKLTDLNDRRQGFKVTTVTNPRQIIGTADIYSKILLPMDGLNTGVLFPDVNTGASAHTWTAHGTAQTDTSTFKFGGASGKFAAGTDWIDTPATADFNWGTNVGSVDTWFNCTATTGTATRLAGLCDVGGNSPFSLVRNAGNFMVGDWCDGLAHYSVTGTTQFTNLLNPGWHHYEFARVPGNILRLWIDGIQEGGDLTLPSNLSMWNFTPGFSVGRLGALVGGGWIGNLDQFRLMVGNNRHVANFTPAAAPYVTPFVNQNAFGFILWLTGNNQGTYTKVATNDPGTGILRLVAAPVRPIQVNDTGWLYPGCDKTIATCLSKYNNVINFGGFPFVPSGQWINSKPVLVG